MSNNSDLLDLVINGLPLPQELPRLLPIAHVSIARWFGEIASKGKLEPRMCNIFNENLVYLFYGGVFYRPHNKPTRNVVELPVAFMFSPRVLKQISRFYPFDTGGLASGRFGTWSDSLKEFKEAFAVNGQMDEKVAGKIVGHVFGSNKSYLQGEPNFHHPQKTNPLQLLFSFYSADLTGEGVDHRQCIIECQSADPILFEQNLIWVGFPESMTEDFARLCEWTDPDIPDYFAYQCHKINNPSEITAKLEEIAKQRIIDRYLKLK